MRTMTGAIVMALGLAATPAFAGETGTGAASAVLASLPTLAAVTPAVAAAPVAAPSSDASFRLGTLAATAAARPLLGFAGKSGTVGEGALHRRLTGAMFDYYPVAGSGFHLSGGTRLFQRRNFLSETESSAGGIMAGPRSVASATTYRAGFKKFNPAVTAGYTLAVSKLAQVGVEAGALMGAAYSGTPGLARFAAGYRGEHEFRPNGVVQLVYGMRF